LEKLLVFLDIRGGLMQNILKPEQEKGVPKRFLLKLAIVSFLTILYFFAGKLGLSLALVNPSATAVWPPAGIALAAFLLLGEYVWPAILLGAFLVNISTSGSPLASFTIAIGNTLEGLVGAYLVNRFAHGLRAFDRARDVLKYALLAGLVGTVISANVGVTSLVWSGLAAPSDYMAVWLTWWLGDAAGIMVVAPLIILWAAPSKLSWTSVHTVEAISLLLSLILLVLAIFSNISPFGTNNYPLEFMIAPWIIWVAFRFGQRETATVTVLISAIALWGTLQGYGPFARNATNESLLLLQSFMIIVAITGLIVAALVSERREIETALRGSNEMLVLSIDRLEQHNIKMILLNEMGDLLQSCSTVEEAYNIIGQLGRRLFPGESGAVYMINNSQNLVEETASWGAYPSEQDTFALDECWALRRGRMHELNESGLELLCPHLKNRPPLIALCIPLMAQGETIGILHVQSGLTTPDPWDMVAFSKPKKQLALATADTIALALANLKLRSSLLHQSIRDALTGLFNRRYLEETLDREVHRATRLQRSVAVIMLDIDYFKRFNDTFGHEAGDTLLRELGSFFKTQIRGGDFACRYGGEEFTLIFPEVSLANIIQRAERLREGVKDIRVEYQDRELGAITISLGVALFPEHGTTAKTLLHAADAALYQAKHEGRDRVIVAPSDVVEEA
jgi:diguanylate cyclase (GGDEF)-like protein